MCNCIARQGCGQRLLIHAAGTHYCALSSFNSNSLILRPSRLESFASSANKKQTAAKRALHHTRTRQFLQVSSTSHTRAAGWWERGEIFPRHSQGAGAQIEDRYLPKRGPDEHPNRPRGRRRRREEDSGARKLTSGISRVPAGCGTPMALLRLLRW